MGTSIGADEGENWGKLANNASSTDAAPSATVLEAAKHIAGRGLWGHNPKGDQNGEKAEDVKREH